LLGRQLRGPGSRGQGLDQEICHRAAHAKEIFDLVRDDLVLVEGELARQSEPPFRLSLKSPRICWGGGKRMRPALLLLSASYAGRKDRSAIRLAAVVELLHSATLIHDDVIDSADTRRGRPSANSKWAIIAAPHWRLVVHAVFPDGSEERQFSHP